MHVAVKMVEVGQVVRFEYNGKARCVRIEKVVKFYAYENGHYTHLVVDYFTGFDNSVNGYRSFTMAKVANLEIVE